MFVLLLNWNGARMENAEEGERERLLLSTGMKVQGLTMVGSSGRRADQSQVVTDSLGYIGRP